MTSLMQIMTELPAAAVILLKVTALLAIGWLLHFALAGRNPRWRVLVWRLVMTGLIVLPLAGWLLPKLRVKVEPPPAPVAAVIETPAPAENMAPMPAVMPAPALQMPGAPAAKAPIWTQAIAHWPIIAIAAWFVAVLAITVRRTYVLMRLRRLVESSAPAPGMICQLAQAIARALGCRAPGLRLTANLLSPFVTGIARPIVVIPSVLTEHARRDDLPAILAHELAHIRSRDLFWMALARWVSTILWFHPLAWKLRAAHGGACEEVCDSVAAEHSGGAPAYSRSLASTFLELVVDAPPAVGVPMIRPTEIMRRIRSLRSGIRFRALTRRRIAAAVIVAAMMISSLGIIQFVRAEVEPPKAASRTIEFPADRSLGWVNFWRSKPDGSREFMPENARAKGKVVVAAGQEVYLRTSAADLGWLKSLKPDDLDSITIDFFKTTDTMTLAPIAHLSGLKSISISKTDINQGYWVSNARSSSSTRKKPVEPAVSPISGKDLAPLATMPNLTNLGLWVNLADDDLAVLRDFKRVHYLQIKLDRMTGAGLENLKAMPALERLSLSGGGKSNVVAFDEAKLAAVKECPNLKTLEIWTGISDTGLAAIGPNPNLESLELDVGELTDSGFASLKQFTNLKKLRMTASNPKLSGKGLKVLAEMPSLREVTVAISGLTQEGFDALRGLKSVKMLNLYYPKLSDAGMAGLVGMNGLSELNAYGKFNDQTLGHIAKLPALKRLSISGTAITDKGVDSIAGLTSLEHVDLNETSITDAAITRLSRMPSLREIGFDNANVTNAALDALSRMKSLKTVTMHDTLITSEAVASFRQAHPECAVYYQPRRKQFSVQIKYLDTHTTDSTEAGRAGVEALINDTNGSVSPRVLTAGELEKLQALSKGGRLRIEPKRIVNILDKDRAVAYRNTTRTRNFDAATSKTITKELGDRVIVSLDEDDKSGAIQLKQIEIMAPHVSELKKYDNITVQPGATLLVNHPADGGRYITLEVKRIK
ncbi:M48 family metalloprotease [bacterium]|nr:M48 family metalloprotease [bacterium]